MEMYRGHTVFIMCWHVHRTIECSQVNGDKETCHITGVLQKWKSSGTNKFENIVWFLPNDSINENNLVNEYKWII